MAIKQQRRLTNLTNPTMVCSYRSYCLDLPVALVDCQMEVFPSHSHHLCQGGYVILYDIDFEGGERKICRDCVDELGRGGRSENSKEVGDSTVYKAV